MKEIRELIQRHRAFFCIFGFIFIVFINCSAFPFYNLNKSWPFMITASKAYIVVLGAWACGVMLSASFSGKGLTFISSALAASASAGLICRYLLEFGEVSNTYNFTCPNIFLHLLIFNAVALLGWLWTSKREGAG